VQRVEIHNFPHGSWQPAKVEEVQPGFDSGNVETYLLTKYGPGTYRFSVIVGQRTFAWRVYKFGDVPDPVGANGNGHAIDPNAVTADEALRQVVGHLRTGLTSAQLSGMLADLESARANRELAPMKHMTDLIAAVIGKIGAPAPAPGNDRIVDLLIAELKEARQDMREIRAAAAAGSAVPIARAPMNSRMIRSI